MKTDAELMQLAKAELREAASFAVVELVQGMARARGTLGQPEIPGEAAAQVFRGLAGQLEVLAAELEVLAELATPGWTVGLTEAELNRAKQFQLAAERARDAAGLSAADAKTPAGEAG